VYVDEDRDGLRDVAERGIPGVRVSAYGADGRLAGSATTDSAGFYTLTVLSGVEYRLEYSGLPEPLIGGPGAPLVRFVTAPNCNIVVPLVPRDGFCQPDPPLATNCYVFGDQQQAGSMEVLVGFPYNAGAHGSTVPSDYLRPAHSVLATAQQAGTTFGLAWQASSRSLFAAAFMKRHAGFGPLGPGGIYRIDRSTGQVQRFVNLNALYGSAVAGSDPHKRNDYFHDPNSWDAVGKLSLGDIDLSEDEQTLWVMNLADRSLYRLDIGLPPLAPASAAAVRRYEVPLEQSDCPDPLQDIRPFALAVHQREVYVGMVCSAQSSGRRADLRAYVYAFEPQSEQFREVLNFPLNYPRGCADAAWTSNCSGKPAEWRPWSAEPIFTQHIEVHPEPWLTDIVFDRDGAMVLGLRDRFPDQRGVRGGNTDVRDSKTYSAIGAGDLLRACPDTGGRWRLEHGASCGPQRTSGAGSGQGPGNGEFYFQEDYAHFGDPRFLPRHHEIVTGGLLQVPGRREVVATAFDAVPVEAPGTIGGAGAIWMSHDTGARTRSYQVYSGSAQVTFGKANGLGDLEALCDPPSGELGNRIWHDIDGDGLQDAGEHPIAGVRVLLLRNGSLVAEARSNSRGEYYFNDRSGGSERLAAYTSYVVRVVTSEGPLRQATLTAANQGASDELDSDGVVAGGFVQAVVKTGRAGLSDHSVDFGFRGNLPAPLPVTVGQDTHLRHVVAALSLLGAAAALLARRRRPRRL
jgi:MYXO-CTERM domain-containing protein